MIVPTAFVHESAYVDEGCKISAGTKIWHFVHILTETVIGKNCSLGQNVTAGPGVTIGDDCKIQNNVSIYKGVTLEQNVFCGPSCVFTNGLTPCANINRNDEFSKTLVRRGCTIGANVTIVCDNTLGEYCMISAGAVVTSDVPAFPLMDGIPEKRIGWISRTCHSLGATLISPGTVEKCKTIDEKLRSNRL